MYNWNYETAGKIFFRSEISGTMLKQKLYFSYTENEIIHCQVPNSTSESNNTNKLQIEYT